MNVAEWILVVILSITLFAFLVLGIILMAKLLGVTAEVKKIVIRGQDIADNASGVVNNVRGMTSIGGAVEMLVDKYITPKLKDNKERKDDGERPDERQKK